MKLRLCMASVLMTGLGVAAPTYAVGTESFESYAPGTYTTVLDNGDIRFTPHNLATAYNTKLDVVNNPADATDGDQFLRVYSSNPDELVYANLTDLTNTSIDGYQLQFDIRWSGFHYQNQQGAWEFDTGPVAIFISPVADADPLSWPGAWPSQLRWSTNGQAMIYSIDGGWDYGSLLLPNEWYRYTIGYASDGNDGLDWSVEIRDVATNTLVSALTGHLVGPSGGGPDWSVHNVGLHTEIWGMRQAVMDLDRINVVPEPAALALTGLGGLLVLRRHRRS